MDFPFLLLSILCIYLPPSLNAASLNQAKDLINNILDDHLTKFQDRQVIVLGDFNSFGVQALCSEQNLIDIVEEPTRKQNILDHILISADLNIVYSPSSLSFGPPVGKSDHLTLIAEPVKPLAEREVIRSHTVFDFRKSNMARLVVRAEEIDWLSSIEDVDNIDTKWLKLHSLIRRLLDETIPQNQVNMSKRDKKWMTPITKLIINQKWDAFRSKDWSRYSFLKIKVKVEIRKAKQKWTQKLKERPYGLWQLTKELSGKKCTDEMDSLISQYSSPRRLAETIASNIASEQRATGKLSHSRADIVSTMTEEISLLDVEKQLLRLKPSKAPGPDNIPNSIYSTLAPFIAKPLQNIFRYSIQNNVFPAEWKKGIIVPVPKTRPPTINKLRTITLLPSPSKILEKLILRKVGPHLELLFGPNQHAFRKNASTTTAIIQLIETISTFHDNPKIPAVGVLSLDLSKAFDLVDHQTLLRKVRAIPALRDFALWLTSYLSDRRGTVRVSGQASKVFPINTGVPQGSVLGPSLFSALVGDLSECSKDKIFVQFADDVNIIMSFPSADPDLIKSSVTKQLTEVRNWCDTNHQVLNVSKSQFMLIPRKQCNTEETSLPIRPTGSMKVLGVLLSKDLQWDCHINEAIKRASRRLHLLRVLRPHTTTEELHIIYHTCVRSIFDYCCPAFCKLPTKLCYRIKSIEKRAHRIIFGDMAYSHCSCKMDGLVTRREDLSLNLLHKILRNSHHILHNYVPTTLTHSRALSNIVCRTTKRQQTFFPYTTLLYNARHSSQSKP